MIPGCNRSKLRVQQRQPCRRLYNDSRNVDYRGEFGNFLLDEFCNYFHCTWLTSSYFTHDHRRLQPSSAMLRRVRICVRQPVYAQALLLPWTGLAPLVTASSTRHQVMLHKIGRKERRIQRKRGRGRENNWKVYYFYRSPFTPLDFVAVATNPSMVYAYYSRIPCAEPNCLLCSGERSHYGKYELFSSNSSIFLSLLPPSPPPSYPLMLLRPVPLFSLHFTVSFPFLQYIWPATTNGTCLSCNHTTYLQSGYCVNSCKPGTQVAYSNVCGDCGPSSFKASYGIENCTLWSTCSQSYQYRSVAGTSTSDAVCVNITVCNSTQYQTIAATLTSDRVCADATMCTYGQGETSALTATSDRVCSACVVGSTFQNTLSQTPCKNVSLCSSNEFQSVAPTISSDRVCSSVLNCTIGQYIATNATFTTNRFCGNCTPGRDRNNLNRSFALFHLYSFRFFYRFYHLIVYAYLYTIKQSWRWPISAYILPLLPI